MSETPQIPNSEQSEVPKTNADLLWDNQKRLVTAIHNATSQKEKDALGRELNGNVADLVEAGEIELGDSWPLSYGENPYVDADGASQEG